ncbi:MAG: PAS domain-containing protein [Cyanobacteria bacterium P01_E01_bin.42]
MALSVPALTNAELELAIVRDPLVVSPETTVMTAIAEMSGVRLRCNATRTADTHLDNVRLEARSSCVLVVESGKVVGILTERDVVRLSAEGRSLERLLIREVAIHPIVTLRESAFTDLFFAINLLGQYGIRHLPVLDDRDCLTGLITHESLRQISRPTDLLRLRLVSEVMARAVICASPDTSILAIAKQMAEHRVSSVVIVESRGNADNLHKIPIGILTERDLVQFRALNLNLETYRAETVMSAPVFAVSPDESLLQVQEMMEQYCIRRVVVAGKQGELAGIVTQTSLLQVLEPLELYKVTEFLEAKVKRLEKERVALLENRTAELERQVKREKLLAELATQIRSSLSLQKILEITTAKIRQVLACDRVTIWQFAEDGSSVVVAESTDSSFSLMGERFDDDYFRAEEVERYRQERIRIVSDIYTTPMSDCHREMLVRLQVRAKILLPLLCGEALWGLLHVSESQHPRDWQTEEVELLQALAVQLALALQQATTHQQLQAELQERQQAEAQLRESEGRYASLVAAVPVGIFRHNATGQGVYVNDRCCEISGLSEEAALGTGWQEGLHPEDRQRVIATWERAVEENRPFLLEYRFQHPDGTVKWVYTQSVPERDAWGRIIGYVGTMTDISDRKEAEAERLQAKRIRLELKLLERLFDIILAGYWDWHIAEERAYLSPSFKRMFGYDDEELPNTPESWQDRIFPEDLPAVLNCFDRHVRSRGQIPFYNEVRYRHKDGSTVWAICSGQVIEWDEEDRPLRVIGFNMNISDRKESDRIILQQAGREKLLREIAEKIRQSLDLQTIFDTACQEIRAVLQADRVGIFKFYPGYECTQGEFAAESASAVFGSVVGIAVKDDCFGMNYAQLYLRDRFLVADNIYHSNLNPCHVNMLAALNVMACMIMPLPCGDELWGLLCVHQCTKERHWQQAEIDFTHQLANQIAIAIQQANLYEQLQQELQERQHAQQQLTERNQQLAVSNEELARATRLKDEFLANMSHELRTPLNAIFGMTEGLHEGIFGEVNAQQIKALQTIKQSGNYLLELINDILDLAKIESGQLELEIAPTAVAPLCRSSLAFIKQQALKKRIQVEIDLCSDLPNLFVDERCVRQVLINLLSNAVKFTPEGGRVTLKVSDRWIAPSHLAGVTWMQSYRATLDSDPRRTEETARPYLYLAVIDTGIGIASQNLEALFQPFVQIDSTLNRQYTGTGLGLALVKRIIELHGGEIGVSSEVGTGSCFTVGLPRANTNLSAARSQDSHSNSIKFDGCLDRESPLILLAEDNRANIITVSSYLRAKGFRIIVAKNGLEAIARAREERPDLILMDIQMPEMDGFEAIKNIRGDRELAKIPIIALTALAMPGDRDRCLAAGADDYLSKPVKLQQLVTVLQQLLASREQNR